MPKLMYAIPVSCNPTGVTWTLERKEAIYALACEFDFIILEDDAYFYMAFPRQLGGPTPGLSGAPLNPALTEPDEEPKHGMDGSAAPEPDECAFEAR